MVVAALFCMPRPSSILKAAYEFWCHFQKCKNFQNRTTRSEVMKIFLYYVELVNIKSIPHCQFRTRAELTYYKINSALSIPHMCGIDNTWNPWFFHNFATNGPILIIFTFLKIALKIVGSFSLFEECGNKNEGAMAD